MNATATEMKESNESSPGISRLRNRGLCGLMVAGATAVLAAAPLQTANAAIVYSGLLTSNNTTNSDSGGPVLLDLNGDGTNDLEIVPVTATKQTDPEFYFSTVSKSQAVDSIFAVDQSGSVSFFAAGTVIDSSLQYADDITHPKLPDSTDAIDDGYIGVAFDPGTGDATQLDYAWIHLQETFYNLSNGQSTLTVLDYAYEDSANTANGTIIAGQTTSSVPEPASLGLIGVGGLALLRRRRTVRVIG